MKEKEIQPSWAQIFVCLCVSILAFWFVFQLTELIMNQFTPKTNWQIYLTVILYLAVIGAEALGCLKLYEYLVRKAIETAEKLKQDDDE